MNDKDITWLEKLFTQHKDDQKEYLDSKFEDLENNVTEVKVLSQRNLDQREEDRKFCESTRNDCRACVNNKIKELHDAIEDVEDACVLEHGELEEMSDEVSKGATKKVLIGFVGAVGTSLVLWTAYGTGAIEYAVTLIKLIF